MKEDVEILTIDFKCLNSLLRDCGFSNIDIEKIDDAITSASNNSI